MSRVLLKQATKKKNERYVTQRFGVLMTPLSREMWIILQSSKCGPKCLLNQLHLLDCNIIHISLGNGVVRTPETSCYKSFIFSSHFIINTTIKQKKTYSISPCLLFHFFSPFLHLTCFRYCQPILCCFNQ